LNAGSLDATFGTGGKVLTPSGADYVMALLRQADGKLIVGGDTVGVSQQVIKRFNPDGTLDSTFGTAGQITVGLDRPDGLVLQADGKLVFVGTSLLPNATALVVMRFLPDGTLDSSFGSGGKTTVTNLEAGPVIVQADGKILVAGDNFDVAVGGMDATFLVRLNADGSIDNTFGMNGQAQTQDAAIFPTALAVQPNGRIIVSTNDELAGFTVGGILDPAFGMHGIVSTGTIAVAGLTVLADGRIVAVGGTNGAVGESQFAVTRYFPNGVPDATFGTGGVTLTTFDPLANRDYATSVAVDADGRYVVAGYSKIRGEFALARYDPNGSLDTTFGSGGKVLTVFGGLSSVAYRALVQPDGRAVAAGTTTESDFSLDFAMARYTADTPLPTANQRFVAQVYLDLLGRPADGIGLAQWSNVLDQGTSRAQVVLAIEGSNEFLTDKVQALYAQYLHRLADPLGLNGGVDFLRSGHSVEQLAGLLVSSPEFLKEQGKGSADGFLDALYQDALDRAVDAPGRASWDKALASGLSYAQVAAAILATPEYRQDTVEEAYGTFLHRQADPTGLGAFTTLLSRGVPDGVMAALLISSPEYWQRVGN
jgi:uncharacterized delta-60 repeat protein